MSRSTYYINGWRVLRGADSACVYVRIGKPTSEGLENVAEVPFTAGVLIHLLSSFIPTERDKEEWRHVVEALLRMYEHDPSS